MKKAKWTPVDWELICPYCGNTDYKCTDFDDEDYDKQRCEKCNKWFEVVR